MLAAEVKPTSSRLESLESLRGVAALIVVLHHMCGTIALPKNFGVDLFGGIFTPGQFGVDIFFVLSGFIIFYTNSKDKVGLQGIKKYTFRRIVRIYPVYWLISIFYVPLVFLTPGTGPPTLDRTGAEVVHSLLLLPYKSGAPILGPAWSLCFEMMFYIMFIPFLIQRKLGWGVWCMWLGGVLAVQLTGTKFTNPYLTQFFSELVLEFFLGMVVALLIRKHAVEKFGKWIFLGVALILVQLLVEWNLGKDGVPYRHMVYGLGSASLIYGLACGDLKVGWNISPFWRMIGLYSYSIYLIHLPIQQVLTKVAAKILGNQQPEWVCYLLCLSIATCSVVAGILLGRYFEQPVLKYYKKRIAG